MMRKFMLSLSMEIMLMVKREANERGVSVQEVLRAVIVPDWLRQVKNPPPEKQIVRLRPWAK